MLHKQIILICAVAYCTDRNNFAYATLCNLIFLPRLQFTIVILDDYLVNTLIQTNNY